MRQVKVSENKYQVFIYGGVAAGEALGNLGANYRCGKWETLCADGD